MRKHDPGKKGDHDGPGTPGSGRVQMSSVGKRSLVQARYGSVGPRPVQQESRAEAGRAAADPDHIQAAAQHGVQGPSQELPHREAIQASFGRHDVSAISAHVGGPAAEASDNMGAEAYAMGQDVAFRQNPSMHTAAHEAAHVVQQRAGVQLEGGVGEVGDRYEQHADAVADRVVRGESAESLLDPYAGGGGGSSVQQKARGTVQMFGTSEHKTAGDQGSKGLNNGYSWKTQGERDGNQPAGSGKFSFVLTHGDLVALSGDFFDPRDTDENQKPIPDSLFRCASTPSSNLGKQPRTQDEVLYALKTHLPGDPRFAKGGMWADVVFGEAVVNAVDSRYLRLAAKNDEHFQNPKGAGSGGPGTPNRASGGGSYRALHEDAILRAHRAKTSKAPVADAMAHEAAAQHFLTDAFAAGHSRTERGSIRSHWRGTYPLFFDNLKKAIAHETAIWMNANITNGATALGSVQDITGSILAEVEKATADLPPFGFDDVVSLVAHDVDNERGLWVRNDLGAEWLTYGDGSFGKGDTAKHCNLAVQLGCKDIQNAHTLDASLSDDAVLSEVKARSPSPAKPAEKFAPEQAVPVVDPKKNSANGTQNWKAPSFEQLWKLPVRTDNPTETYATVITASMKSGELHHKLGGMADKFPASQKVWKGVLGTMTPREGYLKGFFQPIVDDPYSGLQRIIHYNPARGQQFNNTDDAVMEDFDRMDGKDKAAGRKEHASMAGLTQQQRISRVRELLSGSTGSDEGDRIVQVFEGASPADARAIYQAIEGHPWKGDWIQGVFTDDDDLYNGLTSSQLARVKAVLNR